MSRAKATVRQASTLRGHFGLPTLVAAVDRVAGAAGVEYDIQVGASGIGPSMSEGIAFAVLSDGVAQLREEPCDCGACSRRLARFQAALAELETCELAGPPSAERPH